MAKLTRVPAKVFAESAAATEIGQFGSVVAGSKLETSDVATIQGLSAWLNGWSEALVSGNRYPTLQEMNGLLKVLSYQGAYTLQEGTAEYDSATTYYIGSIVKKTGTFELYGSLTNDNVGNALSSDTNWEFLCKLSEVADIDLSNLTAIGRNVITGLVMPDYVNGVTKDWDTSYIADSDGWVYIQCVDIGDINHYFTINDSIILNLGQGSGEDTTFGNIIPVSKDDSYKATGGSSNFVLTFYPCKGA